MSQIPAYQAAASGQPTQAGGVGQFLGAHNAVFVYSGALVVSSQATGSGTYQSSQSQWLSQTITTGSTQTVIGSVNLQLSVVGGSPTLPLVAPLTIGLYADAGGLPSGSAIASAIVSCQYVYSGPFWVPVPLGATVTPSTVYHLVASPVGTSSHYYAWQQSNQAQGAATAPDGVQWSLATYGLMYQVLDSTATGSLLAIYDDGGALITQFTYTALGQLATVTQTAVAQGGSSITSSGTLSYTNGFFTGVS